MTDHRLIRDVVDPTGRPLPPGPRLEALVEEDLRERPYGYEREDGEPAIVGLTADGQIIYGQAAADDPLEDEADPELVDAEPPDGARPGDAFPDRGSD